MNLNRVQKSLPIADPTDNPRTRTKLTTSVTSKPAFCHTVWDTLQRKHESKLNSKITADSRLQNIKRISTESISHNYWPQISCRKNQPLDQEIFAKNYASDDKFSLKRKASQTVLPSPQINNRPTRKTPTQPSRDKRSLHPWHHKPNRHWFTTKLL